MGYPPPNLLTLLWLIEVYLRFVVFMGIKDKRKLSELLMSKSLSCNTPLFHPCLEPSTTPTITVKYHFLGD